MLRRELDAASRTPRSDGPCSPSTTPDRVPTLRDVAALAPRPEPGAWWIAPGSAPTPCPVSSTRSSTPSRSCSTAHCAACSTARRPSTSTGTDAGIVLDLSVVHHDDEALRLVLLAATAWLQTILARRDGVHRIQVLDEAWRLLGSEQTTRYLQACWKLCRDYGVANLAVVHRLSDLRAQADDGTTTAKVSMGLLADTQTRVLFRQASDQLAEARRAARPQRHRDRGPRTARRGRALWKVGGRSAVVQHHIGPGEPTICDTDTRMRTRPDPTSGRSP